MGVCRDKYIEQGFNPVTGKTENAERRTLKVEADLPREEHAAFNYSSCWVNSKH